MTLTTASGAVALSAPAARRSSAGSGRVRIDMPGPVTRIRASASRSLPQPCGDRDLEPRLGTVQDRWRQSPPAHRCEIRLRQRIGRHERRSEGAKQLTVDERRAYFYRMHHPGPIRLAQELAAHIETELACHHFGG